MLPLAKETRDPSNEVVLFWSARDRRLLPEAPVSRHIDVADSFLVDDGRVRGLTYHCERFVDSCALRGVSEEATRAFWRSACRVLPRTGRWFPRVEFAQTSGFRLRLRPAPEPSSSVVLGVAHEPDARRAPRIKGPDFELLSEARRKVAQDGATEALLLTSTGVVLEGAFSSILWWRGDMLCLPPPYLPILPSVTRRMIVELARAQGIEVRFETCLPSDLDGLEVWAVSALNGIRPAIAWAGRPFTAKMPTKAPAWQDALCKLARSHHDTQPSNDDFARV
ncbi:MAG: aminotransferase class IV [Myxococcota bacterium]